MYYLKMEMTPVIVINKSIHNEIALPIHVHNRTYKFCDLVDRSESNLHTGPMTSLIWQWKLLIIDYCQDTFMGCANSRATINTKFLSFDIAQNLLYLLCSSIFWWVMIMLIGWCRENLLQDQLRQAKESVSNMQKLHELAQNQLFEVCAQSGDMLIEICDGLWWTSWWISYFLG